MENPVLLTQRDERGVWTLTMNRPENFNALGDEMLAALQSSLDAVAVDGQARVVVIAARGKAFCPGHNLKEMVAHHSHASHLALFDRCTRMMMTLQRLPVPVIARVQGMATAAGCQLVAQCDLAVASEDARFAVSGIQYGLFCSTPGVALSRNVGTKQALQMLFTGEFIDAHEARQQGLVNIAVPAAELDAALERLVFSILQKPRVAVAMGKQMFYRQRELGVEAAYQLAGATMAHNMMEACTLEGVTAFTEKRQPSWKT